MASNGIKLDELEDMGKDFWSRPTFRHKGTAEGKLEGIYFCIVDDLDATLKDVAEGRQSLYVVGKDPDDDPQFAVGIDRTTA